jgi:hypothetical protein
MRPGARYLCTFLGARFLGYLVFAAMAWELGVLVALPPGARLFVLGGVHVLLAVVLLWYAYWVGRGHRRPGAVSQLVTIGRASKPTIAAPAALGFLTGLSLCPPFVVAGVRAAQMQSIAAALLFFAVFFVGTSAWFLPLVSLGWVRRNEAVTTVARMTMVLIALYYFYLGAAMLVGRKVYGY